MDIEGRTIMGTAGIGGAGLIPDGIATLRKSCAEGSNGLGIGATLGDGKGVPLGGVDDEVGRTMAFKNHNSDKSQ